MNTETDWQTTATVVDPERKIFWESIFGGDQVPVVSIVPRWATLPGFDEPQEVYVLDLKAITDEQRSRLVEALAGKFGLSVGLVARSLDEQGVPIRAADVIMISSDRAQIASLWDDFDDVAMHGAYDPDPDPILAGLGYGESPEEE